NVAHNAVYYQVAGGAMPILLVAAGRAVRLRWPATTAALVYMAFSFVMIWILQLAPATPKLAPVFNPLTHMVPPPFPLLLVVPAVAIDLLMQRAGPGRDWRLAALVGLAFLAVFFVTQWFFTEFLLSPHSHNFLFGVDHWDYSSRTGPWRYRLSPADTEPVTPRPVGVAAGLRPARVRLLARPPRAVRGVLGLPGFWDPRTAAPPPPDVATPVPGDSTLYSAALWLMSSGSYSVRVTVEGSAGTGTTLV